jgi:hypothetical protein
VTHETAQRLYTDYLHNLNDVSRLEIVGFYSEAASAEQVAMLHVFGRSLDVPKRYYYRRWEDQSLWTPWEPIELDINADHLIPIVSGGRLYLFWPEFTQTDNPNPTTTRSRPMRSVGRLPRTNSASTRSTCCWRCRTSKATRARWRLSVRPMCRPSKPLNSSSMT